MELPDHMKRPHRSVEVIFYADDLVTYESNRFQVTKVLDWHHAAITDWELAVNLAMKVRKGAGRRPLVLLPI